MPGSTKTILSILIVALAAPMAIPEHAQAHRLHIGGTVWDLVVSADDYRQMAANVYKAPGSTAERVGVPAGWTLMQQDTVDQNAGSGLLAKVYRSNTTNELVIAFAGTDAWAGAEFPTMAANLTVEALEGMRLLLKEGLLEVRSLWDSDFEQEYAGLPHLVYALVSGFAPPDIATDLAFFQETRNVMPAQFRDAVTAARTVYKKYGTSKNYVFTGHSLGGAVASYLGWAMGVTTVAYNAPFLNQAMYREIGQYRPFTPGGAAGFQILNFQSQSATGGRLFNVDAVSHITSHYGGISGAIVPVFTNFEDDVLNHSLDSFRLSHLDSLHPGNTRVNFVEAEAESDVFAKVTPAFHDVKPGSWVESYVSQGLNLGLFHGKNPTHFGASDYLTRAEMAVVIVNLADLLNERYMVAGSRRFLPVEGLSSGHFTDIGHLGGKMRDAITRMAVNGSVATGPNNSRFRPDDPILLSEFCTMLVVTFRLNEAIDAGGDVGNQWKFIMSPRKYDKELFPDTGDSTHDASMRTIHQSFLQRSFQVGPQWTFQVEPIANLGGIERWAKVPRRLMAKMVVNTHGFVVQHLLVR